MKRFKIGLAVLAALATMSFTISSRTGVFEGTYSVESITCWNVLTINSTAYDADDAVQIHAQTTPGLKTVNSSSADVDLAPGAPELKASQVVQGAVGSVRVRTCTNVNVTFVCCFELNAQGGIIKFATGIAITFF